MTSWMSPTSSSEATNLLLHRGHVSGEVRVEVAFTGNGIDLAERSDDSRATEAAVTRLSDILGVPVVRMRQVHGVQVHHVVRGSDGSFGPVPEADALVTTEPGVALLARSADCVPVLLADTSVGVVGAVHAGRVGFDRGVVGRCVEHMRELGAVDLQAWVGPAACGSCYEVPAEMRDDVASRHPVASSTTSWGTPALDVPAGVAAELRALGVQVDELGPCTIEDARTFSHRREQGRAGRSGALVWVAA